MGSLNHDDPLLTTASQASTLHGLRLVLTRMRDRGNGSAPGLGLYPDVARFLLTEADAPRGSRYRPVLAPCVCGSQIFFLEAS
jgi:hypothetical protein